MPEPKYITINGVMKKNPNYVPEGKGLAPKSPANASMQEPLAIISSVQDLTEACEIQTAQTGIPVPIADSTSATIEMMQDEDMLANYKAQVPLDGGIIIDEIGTRFSHYEIPLGMLNKLMMLTSYKLDFIIDDSGSMTSLTDVDIMEATEPVKSMCINGLRRELRPGDKLSRINEAEDRLHIMIGILAYVPVEHIQIRFLNNPSVLILDRTAKTPDEFEHYAHQEIRRIFSTLRYAGTPVRAALEKGFSAEGKWCHYLFNDGEPNESGAAIARQIQNRPHPENHPLTLISCTNNDRETAWMKLVDAEATYVAEIDDFSDEKNEVIKNQGALFPYTKGLWIISHLVAAICPFDLDALDENLPFTKSTLDNLLGRKLNPYEYEAYFTNNPNASLYVNEYARFLTEEKFAQEIISSREKSTRERNAGYVEGERPNRPLNNISARLAPITQAEMQKFVTLYSEPQKEEDLSMMQASMTGMSLMMPNVGFFAAPPMPPMKSSAGANLPPPSYEESLKAPGYR